MTKRCWVKSSYSGANGDCVELVTTLDAVRDSKDRNGPILCADLRSFIDAVKSGRFDH